MDRKCGFCHQNLDDRFRVRCSKQNCLKWFHGACVNIDKIVGLTFVGVLGQISWSCPDCCCHEEIPPCKISFKAIVDEGLEVSDFPRHAAGNVRRKEAGKYLDNLSQNGFSHEKPSKVSRTGLISKPTGSINRRSARAADGQLKIEQETAFLKPETFRDASQIRVRRGRKPKSKSTDLKENDTALAQDSNLDTMPTLIASQKFSQVSLSKEYREDVHKADSARDNTSKNGYRRNGPKLKALFFSSNEIDAASYILDRASSPTSFTESARNGENTRKAEDKGKTSNSNKVGDLGDDATPEKCHDDEKIFTPENCSNILDAKEKYHSVTSNSQNIHPLGQSVAESSTGPVIAKIQDKAKDDSSSEGESESSEKSVCSHTSSSSDSDSGVLDSMLRASPSSSSETENETAGSRRENLSALKSVVSSSESSMSDSDEQPGRGVHKCVLSNREKFKELLKSSSGCSSSDDENPEHVVSTSQNAPLIGAESKPLLFMNAASNQEEVDLEPKLSTYSHSVNSMLTHGLETSSEIRLSSENNDKTKIDLNATPVKFIDANLPGTPESIQDSQILPEMKSNLFSKSINDESMSESESSRKSVPLPRPPRHNAKQNLLASEASSESDFSLDQNDAEKNSLDKTTASTVVTSGDDKSLNLNSDSLTTSSSTDGSSDSNASDCGTLEKPVIGETKIPTSSNEACLHKKMSASEMSSSSKESKSSSENLSSPNKKSNLALSGLSLHQAEEIFRKNWDGADRKKKSKAQRLAERNRRDLRKKTIVDSDEDFRKTGEGGNSVKNKNASRISRSSDTESSSNGSTKSSFQRESEENSRDASHICGTSSDEMMIIKTKRKATTRQRSSSRQYQPSRPCLSNYIQFRESKFKSSCKTRDKDESDDSSDIANSKLKKRSVLSSDTSLDDDDDQSEENRGVKRSISLTKSQEIEARRPTKKMKKSSRLSTSEDEDDSMAEFIVGDDQVEELEATASSSHEESSIHLNQLKKEDLADEMMKIKRSLSRQTDKDRKNREIYMTSMKSKADLKLNRRFSTRGCPDLEALLNGLRPLASSPDLTSQEILSEWKLLFTEEDSSCQAVCICGKSDLRYLTWIHNRNIKNFIRTEVTAKVCVGKSF